MAAKRGDSEYSGHSHSSGHHHRKSPWRRFKHYVKRKLMRHKWLIPSMIVIMLIIAGAAYWMYSSFRSMQGSQLTAANSTNVGSGYRNITYKGKEYRYNSRITTILYVGVDSDGEMTPNKTYISAPNADSISLVVLDELNKKMTIIAIPRNTICKIHRFAVNGLDRGEFTDFLCLAYSYGENGVASAKNLCQAVSKICYGIPVNEYVITNRSSLPEIIKVLGDVTVTVPNDDLTDYGFIKGEKATINAYNVETFVRHRDTGVDLSNIGRMERQKTFINATVEKISDMLKNSPNDTWKKIEAAEYCMQTNITRSRYLDLTRAVSVAAYDEQNYYIPKGEDVVGKYYDEFYIDEEQLLDRLVDIFYLEC